jgi:hypothetical protein
VGHNEGLQLQLVEMLLYSSHCQEATYFAQRFNLPDDKLPDDVR